MIIWGFNLIAGYTFLIALGGTFAKVGNWLPLILIFSSVVAFGAGVAFGKLSSYYNKNGGTLIFTRHAFGKTVGGFFGVYQLLQLPILGASIPITTIWLFFNTNWTINGTQLSSLWWVYVLAWFFIVVLSLIPLFGFLSNRYTLLFLWFLKWIIVVFSIIMALIEIKHFGQNIFNNHYSGQRLSYLGLIAAVVQFFFAFGGFEAVAAQTADIEDGKEKITSILLTMIIMVCLFYVLYYFLILGGLGARDPDTSDPKGVPSLLPSTDTRSQNPFETNPINSLILAVIRGRNTSVFSEGAVTGVTLVLVIFAIITQLASKASSRLQSGWGNPRIVAAFSDSGYLPKIFKFENKYQKAVYAFWLDYLICVSLAIVFIALSFAGKYLVSGILDIISYISFMQYFGVTLAAVVLSFKDKKFILSMFEKIFFSVIAIIIFVLLVSYTVDGFIIFGHYVNGAKYYDGNKLDQSSLTIVIDVIMLTIIFIGAIVLLVIGNILGWHKDDPGDTKLDDEIDDLVGHDLTTFYKGM